ncbi:hypothetical protein [Proteiniborus ethanoligenes]|nr:hypothetical protein [Proteiniborus ethanoligenes]
MKDKLKNGTFIVENYAAQQRITQIDSRVSSKVFLAKEDMLENVRNIQL